MGQKRKEVARALRSLVDIIVTTLSQSKDCVTYREISGSQ